MPRLPLPIRHFLVHAGCALGCLPAQAATLPAAITAQIPNGFEVSLARSADFNSDGHTDHVIVASELANPGIQRSANTAPKRVLMVFLQAADGRYTLAGTNAQVAYAQAEGHQCDPLLDSGGLAAKGRFFTVENSLACGQHWTDYITFRYDPSLNRFVFYKRIVEVWRLNSSASSSAPALVLSHRKVTDAAQDKPVFLEAYRARP